MPTPPVTPTEDGRAKFYAAPDARPAQAQMEDLLGQMGEEVRMDARTADVDPTEDLVRRLERLKGKPVRGFFFVQYRVKPERSVLYHASGAMWF